MGQNIKQFIKFGLIGLANTAVNQGVYMLCTRLGLYYVAASVMGFIISVLNAYVWQSRFVFEAQGGKRTWWKTLIKTYAAYAFTGLFLTNVLLVFWIDVLHIENYITPATELLRSVGIATDNRTLAKDIAPLLNIAVNVPLNFVINKFWAYRENGASPQEEPHA